MVEAKKSFDNKSTPSKQVVHKVEGEEMGALSIDVKRLVECLGSKPGSESGKSEIDGPFLEIDLERAKEVLKDIVETDEHSLSEVKNFAKKHSGETVRGAMLAVTFNLLLTHPHESTLHRVLRKTDGDKNLTLCFLTDSTQEVSLQLNSEPTNTNICHDYTYMPIAWHGGKYQSGFFYHQNGEHKMEADTARDVSLPGGMKYHSRYDTRYFPSPTPVADKEYQDIFYGLRWHALNLLTWDDPEIKMPEDLPNATRVISHRHRELNEGK